MQNQFPHIGQNFPHWEITVKLRKHITGGFLNSGDSDRILFFVILCQPGLGAPVFHVLLQFLILLNDFLNSLHHSVEVMRRGGVDVEMEQAKTEEEMRVTIRIRR